MKILSFMEEFRKGDGVMSQGETIREESLGGDALMYRLYSVVNEDGTSYGIEVKTSLFGDEHCTKVDDITTRREIAEDLFEMLVRNLVLPSTLKDIVEDYVQEIYS